MQLAGPGVFGPPRDRDAALAVLRRAVELGVDHIDTSQYYGPDVVNELIREALAPVPRRPGARHEGRRAARRPRWVAAGPRPEELRAGVEDNLRTLGVERLALVNLRLLEEESRRSPCAPLAEMLGALEDLRVEGKVEAIGISNATRAQVEAALDLADLASVQNALQPVRALLGGRARAVRRARDGVRPVLPAGLRVLRRPGEAGGRAGGRRRGRAPRATPSQVALAWLLHRAPNVLLIPGTSSVAHLEENLAAGDLTLSDDDLAGLDTVASAPA